MHVSDEQNEIRRETVSSKQLSDRLLGHHRKKPVTVHSVINDMHLIRWHLVNANDFPPRKLRNCQDRVRSCRGAPIPRLTQETGRVRIPLWRRRVANIMQRDDGRNTKAEWSGVAGSMENIDMLPANCSAQRDVRPHQIVPVACRPYNSPHALVLGPGSDRKRFRRDQEKRNPSIDLQQRLDQVRRIGSHTGPLTTKRPRIKSHPKRILCWHDQRCCRQLER